MNNKLSPISPGADLSEQLVARQMREKSIQRLEEGLEATHAHYDITQKKVVYTPDHKTRLAAAATLLAYTDGKPIERREKVTVIQESAETIRARIGNSPALRKAMRELLDEGEFNKIPDSVKSTGTPTGKSNS